VQPLYLMVTPSNANGITAAKDMPIEPGATYVFDLGYYDYGLWTTLDQGGCRIVTRLKSNTPFAVVEDRPVALGSSILSDRTGCLPSPPPAAIDAPGDPRHRARSGRMRKHQLLRERSNPIDVIAGPAKRVVPTPPPLHDHNLDSFRHRLWGRMPSCASALDKGHQSKNRRPMAQMGHNR
jgi:hypothetical protein